MKNDTDLLSDQRKLPSQPTAYETIEKRCEIVELEHSISSVKERIRDIEWKIQSSGEALKPDSLVERQKALDKLRYLNNELSEAKKSLIRLEAQT